MASPAAPPAARLDGTGARAFLHFAEDFGGEQYRLFELPDDVLAAVEANDGAVCIKGGEADEAVLCTDAHTYDVKKVETSNTVLLVGPPGVVSAEQIAAADDASAQRRVQRREKRARDARIEAEMQVVRETMERERRRRDAQLRERLMGKVTSAAAEREAAERAASEAQAREDARVAEEEKARTAEEATTLPTHLLLGQVDCTYQLKLMLPTMARLRTLLERRPFSGEENAEFEDEATQGPLYSLEALEGAVQASRVELLAGLAELHALEVDGHWRMVERAYEREVFDLILAALDEHGWDWHAVPRDAMVRAVADTHDARVVRHVLARFRAKPAEKEEEEEQRGGDTVALDERAVATYRAVAMLRDAAGEEMRALEFEVAWQDALPGGMRADVDTLRGVALQEMRGSERYVVYYPHTALPAEPKARFRTLFERRRLWTHDDLWPYVCDVRVHGSTSEEVLLMYARVTQPDKSKPPMYSKRDSAFF